MMTRLRSTDLVRNLGSTDPVTLANTCVALRDEPSFKFGQLGSENYNNRMALACRYVDALKVSLKTAGLEGLAGVLGVAGRPDTSPNTKFCLLFDLLDQVMRTGDFTLAKDTIECARHPRLPAQLRDKAGDKAVELLGHLMPPGSTAFRESLVKTVSASRARGYANVGHRCVLDSEEDMDFGAILQRLPRE